MSKEKNLEEYEALILDNGIKESSIENPNHYTGPSGMQVWDFIHDYNLNFNLGSVAKYIARAGKKTSDPTKDLEKAIHYLQRELFLVRSNHG